MNKTITILNPINDEEMDRIEKKIMSKEIPKINSEHKNKIRNSNRKEKERNLLM